MVDLTRTLIVDNKLTSQINCILFCLRHTVTDINSDFSTWYVIVKFKQFESRWYEKRSKKKIRAPNRQRFDN